MGATYAQVIGLMDQLRCEGIQRLVLESTSDYWRVWYYLAEAAGLEVWLVNARDVKHLPGQGQERPARLRVALQAERAGHAAPLVRPRSRSGTCGR